MVHVHDRMHRSTSTLAKCTPDIIYLVGQKLQIYDLIKIFATHGLDFNAKFTYDASNWELDVNVCNMIFESFPNIIVQGLNIRCANGGSDCLKLLNFKIFSLSNLVLNYMSFGNFESYDNCQYGDMEKIVKICPNIISLNLCNFICRSDTLIALEKCKSLRSLGFTNVNGDSIEKGHRVFRLPYLPKLLGLKKLTFSTCVIDDTMLRHISECPKLVSLNLNECVSVPIRLKNVRHISMSHVKKLSPVAKDCPNLLTLRMSWWEYIDSLDICCPNLKHVELYWYQGIFKLDFLIHTQLRNLILVRNKMFLQQKNVDLSMLAAMPTLRYIKLVNVDADISMFDRQKVMICVHE